MTLPAPIHDLIQRFEDNQESYLSPAYNETQLRREFLDPFFAQLGWDLENRAGYAELYKDVLHEDSIKIGESSKAPDYSFRIGGVRKFFVEAKRPSLDIKTSAEAAYQLRRYAWSAKLPLSVLTNFRQFAVYDCRVGPPKRTDAASVGRVDFFTYSNYPARWDDLASRFSKDAILRGSFDRFSESAKAKHGTQEVDVAFLGQMEEWREELARNIALRNPRVNEHELNVAVQLTLDRIVFLRICEDRGIERYGQLREIADQSPVYGALRAVLEKADARYNSGLFYFQHEQGRHEPPDTVTPRLKIDDRVLRDIIRSLYYPDSPYEFSVLPVEILGQAYERFLGKVIRLTGSHHARIEEKPEVRRAGGVYYTPEFIVKHIVERTVGLALHNRTPRQVDRLRILDPACGSGSFLLGAYEYLLKWHREWYVKDGADKHKAELYRGRGNEWHLSTKERKRILLNNIFGVDIDPQAVEVTKLSLMLKVLEGETEETLSRQYRLFHERALPDLGDNIKCGNSLIEPDFYGLAERTEDDEVNAFDWKKEFSDVFRSGGFDVVIGNPPYDVMEKERGEASWPHSALAEYARQRADYRPALGGKLNLFRFFIVRSLQLLKTNGRYGMIVPLALLADISCAQTRRHLMSSTTELRADCFPQKDNPRRRVFLEAKLSTVVITATRSGASPGQIGVRVYPWNSFDDPYRECYLTLEELALIDPENVPIPLVDATSWSLCKKLHTGQKIRRFADVEWLSVTRGEINQTIYRRFIKEESRGMARLVKGVEVGRFEIHSRLSQGAREWFNEAAFLRHNSPRPVVKLRRIATQRITGVDERVRIVATIIEPPAYFADSTNSVAIVGQSQYELEFVLGLLNSWLFQWRFKLTSTNNNVGTNELACMPFRLIDFGDAADKARQGNIVELVKRITTLKAKLNAATTSHEATARRRQVNAIDEQIDRAVYELYGLSASDIDLVEASRDQDAGGPIMVLDSKVAERTADYRAF